MSNEQEYIQENILDCLFIHTMEYIQKIKETLEKTSFLSGAYLFSFITLQKRNLVEICGS